MANAVLGLGQGQAGALNSDLIEKLRAADRKSSVEPLEKKLETFSKEKEVISNIGTKVDDFLKSLEIFSLNQSSGVNSFNQKSANVMGEGVVFVSDDLSSLKAGSLSVKVEQLAQNDAWQTDIVSGSKDQIVGKGTLTINGKSINTDGMTYKKLTEEINKISGVQASLVDSSSGGFRLSIKSTETGTANKINFNTKDISGNDLGVSSGAAKLFGNIAQKDEWQTAINVSKDQIVPAGKITINGKEIDTANKDYETLINEINNTADIGVKASLVDSSDGKFRLSIQSTETGADKKIDFKVSGGSISAGALALFGNSDKSALDNSLNVVEAKDNTIDGANNVLTAQDNTIDGANNVLTAQDMQLKADGVDYSSSSNTVTIDGLKITATKETGDSTINIENDTTTLSAQMKNFADKFNELRATIENEIYSADASVDDKDALRNMLETVKSVLFGSGNSGDNSIFGYGFTFDEKNGNLNFNPKDFESAIKDGTKDLEALFAGVDEKKGIGTILDETISVSGITKSLIDYELNMLSREDALNKEKEVAEASLDSKYSIMSQQFAAYGIMINQMEASFSGLKMMIQQSMVSK